MTKIKGQRAHRGKRISERAFAALWNDTSLTESEIGAILGVSRGAVYCRAKARGLPKRRAGGSVPRPYPDLADIYLSNVRICDLAALYGVTPASVYRAAARLGLPKRAVTGKAGVPLADYLAWQAYARMAAAARHEQAAMINAELADQIGSRRVGADMARRA